MKMASFGLGTYATRTILPSRWWRKSKPLD